VTMSEVLHIGLVESIGKDRKTATLVPLFASSGYELVRIRDEEAQFPSRGRVVLFDLPAKLERGSIWQFQVRESPSFDPSERRFDQYMVRGEPRSIVEIVKSYENEDEGRESLMAGVKLANSPVGKSYVRIGADRIIGPLDLIQDVGRTYRIDPRANDDQVHVSYIDPKQIMSVEYNGSNWEFVSPLYCMPAKAGDLDWGRDEAVVTRAIRLLKKAQPELYKELALSDRIIRHLSETIVTARMSVVEADRVRRARKIVAEGKISGDLIRELADQCERLPSVRTHLEEEVKRARERAISEAMEETTRNLAAERTEVARLRGEVEGMKKSRDELHEEIEQTKAKKDEILESLETTMSARVAEIARQPEKLLVEYALMRPFIEAMGVGASNAKHFRARETPHHLETQMGKMLQDPAAALVGVNKAFSAVGIDAWIGQLLYISHVAGLFPCLMGINARVSLQAYASSLFAGASIEIPMDPGMLGVDDLLGQFDGAMREFLEGARRSNRMHLLVIEGVNRALAESSVVPLLRAASLTRRAWPAPVVENWPRNVLVATTLSDSTATIPIPSELLDYSTVIAADALPSLGTTESGGELEESTMGFETWQKMATGPHESYTPAWRAWIKEKAPACELSRALTLKADAFYRSARLVLNSDLEALAATIGACLGLPLSRVPDPQRAAAIRVVDREVRLAEIVRCLSRINIARGS
jgi:hypothetical protein